MLPCADPSVLAYLQHVQVSKRLASKTLELYGQALAQLENACKGQGIVLVHVQAHHVRRWVAQAHSAGKGAKTLALLLSGWRGFYKWAVQEGLCPVNPVDGVKTPKVGKPLPKALGVDAAVALANQSVKHSIEDSDQAKQTQTTLIIELLYGCGLRVSELVGLDTQPPTQRVKEGTGWIDAQADEVHVQGKGGKRRMVPLGAAAKTALIAHMRFIVRQGEGGQQAQPLLHSPRGARISRQAVWALVRERGRMAGLDAPVHPHMLRHSFASHVLQSSGDLRAVQELLGHSSIASTQVYTRLDFQHLAKIYDNTHPRAKAST